MKHVIDFDTWERKDNFNFFRHFVNPSYSITSEVECSAAKTRAREKGESFFLHYLYAILRAANEIKELRYRLQGENQIILYDTVDVLTPIRLSENGNFYTVRIPWETDFEKFHSNARAIIEAIPKDGSPYSEEHYSSDTNPNNVILVSATPDLYFTSITHTQENPSGSGYPLLNAGKAVVREGKLVMPIALYTHHGFVDGKHLADFYRKVEEVLCR